MVDAVCLSISLPYLDLMPIYLDLSVYTHSMCACFVYFIESVYMHSATGSRCNVVSLFGISLIGAGFLPLPDLSRFLLHHCILGSPMTECGLYISFPLPLCASLSRWGSG